MSNAMFHVLLASPRSLGEIQGALQAESRAIFTYCMEKSDTRNDEAAELAPPDLAWCMTLLDAGAGDHHNRCPLGVCRTQPGPGCDSRVH